METKNAQLATQMAAMTQELTQKSEEIRKYHAEHAVVLSRVRELVGHLGEIVNKAHLYDQLMESGDPASARQTLPILIFPHDEIFAEGNPETLTPKWYPQADANPGPPISPTDTLYEVIGEVELVSASHAGVGPSQPPCTSKVPNPEEFHIKKGPLFQNGLVHPRHAR